MFWPAPRIINVVMKTTINHLFHHLKMHMLPLSQWHIMVYNQEKKKIKIQTIKVKTSTVQNQNKNKYHTREPGDNNAFLSSIILANALEKSLVFMVLWPTRVGPSKPGGGDLISKYRCSNRKGHLLGFVTWHCALRDVPSSMPTLCDFIERYGKRWQCK